MRPVVRAVHDISVGPFEIESIDERLTHAPILERRKFVTGGPRSRGELLAEQITLCGEAFETDLPVAVVFVADGVEIIQPPGDRQVGAPPILDPVEFDGMPDLKAPDLVRATAKRDFQR